MNIGTIPRLITREKMDNLDNSLYQTSFIPLNKILNQSNGIKGTKLHTTLSNCERQLMIKGYVYFSIWIPNLLLSLAWVCIYLKPSPIHMLNLNIYFIFVWPLYWPSPILSKSLYLSELCTDLLRSLARVYICLSSVLTFSDS